MDIVVLRLSHRTFRDKRMSTHLALTARAFGASNLVYSGDHDNRIEQSIEQIVTDWGGTFSVKYLNDARRYIKEWKKSGGSVVHLTMFGVELSEKIEELKQLETDILVIVGGAKVPIEFYHLSDYNIAIGHQPHSEVAALAVFLNELTAGEARKTKYSNAQIEIIPTEKGKIAVKKNT
ncbi:MAG: tRNA (cytidine(56)-2'-O)-methyltransferase [Candidatus Heimdallarchaeaceae archaeon]